MCIQQHMHLMRVPPLLCCCPASAQRLCPTPLPLSTRACVGWRRGRGPARMGRQLPPAPTCMPATDGCQLCPPPACSPWRRCPLAPLSLCCSSGCSSLSPYASLAPWWAATGPAPPTTPAGETLGCGVAWEECVVGIQGEGGCGGGRKQLGRRPTTPAGRHCCLG